MQRREEGGDLGQAGGAADAGGVVCFVGRDEGLGVVEGGGESLRCGEEVGEGLGGLRVDGREVEAGGLRGLGAVMVEGGVVFL